MDPPKHIIKNTKKNDNNTQIGHGITMLVFKQIGSIQPLVVNNECVTVRHAKKSMPQQIKYYYQIRSKI